MNIVDQILQKIPSLKPFYDDTMKAFYYVPEPDEFDECLMLVGAYEPPEPEPTCEINIGTELTCLNRSFNYYVEQNDFQPLHIKLMLDMLENFAQTTTEDELGALEVMFFEDLVCWAEDKEDEYAEKYGDYFLSCIGPKCQELCDRNREFWAELHRAERERNEKSKNLKDSTVSN
jgi:hypothetical protein